MSEDRDKAYASCREDIDTIMECIRLELDKEDKQAKEEPKNWGYVGDVRHVREELKEVLCFLMGQEGSDEMVEEHLEEMRETAKETGKGQEGREGGEQESGALQG